MRYLPGPMRHRPPRSTVHSGVLHFHLTPFLSPGAPLGLLSTGSGRQTFLVCGDVDSSEGSWPGVLLDAPALGFIQYFSYDVIGSGEEDRRDKNAIFTTSH